MTQYRMLPFALAAALLAGPALATEEPPVATADPALTQSTAEQIDAYLRASPAVALPEQGNPGVISGEDAPRQVHGVVEVGVGTHGYRSVYMQSDMPIGKTGTLSVAVGESRGPAVFGGYGGYGGGYGYGRSGTRQTIGIGLDFSGDAHDDRRCEPGSWTDDGPRRLDPASVDGERRLPCGAGRGPRTIDALR
ncbi:MAG: hypothetical protein ABW360_06515 [Phenylobacterium sp.]